MDSIKITDDTVLAITPLPPQTVGGREWFNDETGRDIVAMLDTSGSMSWEQKIENVRRDMKTLVAQLRPNDTLTAGYFNTYGGSYSIFLRGHRMRTQQDRDDANRLIDKHLHAGGATCFSEILAEFPAVIRDVKTLSQNGPTLFVMFSDGEPCVPSYTREESAILAALEALRPLVTGGALMGYGDYYNRPLMARMASTMGSVVVVDGRGDGDFDRLLTKHVIQTTAGERLVEIANTATAKAERNFIIRDGAPVPVIAGPGGKCVVPASCGNVYSFLRTPNCFQPTIKTGERLDEAALRGLYGLALLFTLEADNGMAAQVISAVGDAAIANQLMGAFTPAEAGAVQTVIERAITNTGGRFLGGRSVGCVPNPAAFCLWDALNLLMQDENAYYYPGEYKRTGLRKIYPEGALKFEADETQLPVSLYDDGNGGAWTFADGEGYLNVGIKFKRTGVVRLGRSRPKMIGARWPTYTYATHLIILDGLPNMDYMHCSMSKDVFNQLRDAGMIEPFAGWVEGEVYPLDLRAVPVMNYAMAQGKNSITDLCRKQWTITVLRGYQKIYNALLEELQPRDERKAEAFTDVLAKIVGPEHAKEAADWFIEKGVSLNGYHAKGATDAKPDDFRIARKVKIAVKDYKTPPALKDLRAKIEKINGWNGKGRQPALTGYEQIANEALGEYETECHRHGASPATMSPAGVAEMVAWLQDELADIRRELRQLRAEIMAVKFGVILGHRPWSDLKAGETEIAVDGHTFLIDTEPDQIGFSIDKPDDEE